MLKPAPADPGDIPGEEIPPLPGGSLKFGRSSIILISNAERPKIFTRKGRCPSGPCSPLFLMDLEQLLRTKEFLEEMSASIRNILLARFPGMAPQEKEDIDEEVKLKLWKKATGGKKIDNLRSYLWRVVYTTALDLLGERMSHQSLEKIEEANEKNRSAPPEMLTPDFALQSSELKMMIENALDLIPERRRTVLRLHFDGKDIPQISSLLSSSENQVRHLLYRGLRELRMKMKLGEKGNQ